jgi:CRP-like cAMP-binding protein
MADILENFALHIALTPEEQAEALTFFQEQNIKKRRYLLQPGETEKHIYFVRTGCVRMFYGDKDGFEHNIMFYPENWWACDMISFFKQKPAYNAIQALEDTSLYALSFSNLERLFVQIPKFERFFRILTQNGFELYQTRITSNLFKTAEERYLEFRKQYPGLEQRIAQKHIATYLGITPVFLSMMRKDKNI